MDGTNTEYYYNGSVLMYMITGSGSTAIQQRFSYDADGNLVAVVYKNGTSTAYTYYYLRNAQGDIVKLIDSNGNTVVEYLYDSWGKLLSVTGTLAATLGADQPFRYRGYVYDTETGWYYLQSRYYDPETCRFISADVYLSTGQGVIGHNSYCYCNNDPVVMHDTNGEISELSGANVGELTKKDMMCLGGGGFVVAIVILLSYGPLTAKNRSYSAPNIELKNRIRQIRDKLKDLLDLLTSIIAAAAAKAIAKGKQFGKHHNHHIIAKAALAAAPARLVYVWVCKQNINGKANLVLIRDCVHMFLHNAVYYSTINALIIGAYAAGGITGVDKMLSSIKDILSKYY